jgi:ATP-dependent Clp protease ATP-binding subunit ClpC
MIILVLNICLLGMIREGEGVAVGVLKKLGVPLDELRSEVEKVSKGTATHEVKNLANIPLTKASEKVLKITYLEAKIFKAQLIGTEHLLLSILRDGDNLATQILNKFDVNYETVKEMLEYQAEGPQAASDTDDPDDDSSRIFGGGAGGGAGKKKRKEQKNHARLCSIILVAILPVWLKTVNLIPS